jgi:hypothetical protein
MMPTSSSFISRAASDTGVSGATVQGFLVMSSEIFIVSSLCDPGAMPNGACDAGKRRAERDVVN